MENLLFLGQKAFVIPELGPRKLEIVPLETMMMGDVPTYFRQDKA